MTEEAWESAHVGDIVRGADGQDWGVAGVEHVSGGTSVTLYRHGAIVAATLPLGTPCRFVERADMSVEAGAAQALLNAGLGPVEIVSERWT